MANRPPLITILLLAAIPFAAMAQNGITIYRGTGAPVITTEVRIDPMGFDLPQTIVRGAVRVSPAAPARTGVTTIITINFPARTRLTDRARHASWLDWTRDAQIRRRLSRSVAVNP